MSGTVSQNTSVTIVDSNICSGTDQINIKTPRYCPLRGGFTGDRRISPQKGPEPRKSFPFDDVIMYWCISGAFNTKKSPAIWNKCKILRKRIYNSNVEWTLKRSNHRQLEYWFNILFRLATKKSKNVASSNMWTLWHCWWWVTHVAIFTLRQ